MLILNVRVGFVEGGRLRLLFFLACLLAWIGVCISGPHFRYLSLLKPARGPQTRNHEALTNHGVGDARGR